MSHKILIVDDEDLIRESLAFILRKEGFVVTEARNGAEAVEEIKTTKFDICITDIEMPKLRGTELLDKISEISPDTFVIIITAYASIETAITALRKGAFDYIIKPIDFDDLILRVRKLLDYKNLILENSLLRKEVNRQYDFHNIIGHSEPMKDVFKIISKISPSDGTVLVSGRSGTGKELVARAIHFNSKRAHKHFAAINCGAIVETLFESELFGHKKGSFTGAINDKDGMFKFADGGTLFLDEISEIPLHLQVKLLRAIELKEILPVGSTQTIKTDVRIIAATNKNLPELIAMGKFREDLYYRINIVEIQLPSLSDRIDDIPLLVSHFIEIFKNQMGKNINGISKPAMDLLLKYSWRGEIRELQNVIERAVIFCSENLIQPNHFPEYIQELNPASSPINIKTLKEAVHQCERQYIERAFKKHGHDMEKIAEELDISLSSLYRKIDELHVDKKTFKL